MRGVSFGPLGLEGGVSPTSGALCGPRGEELGRLSSAEITPVVAALGSEEPDEIIAEVEWKFTGVPIAVGQTLPLV